MLSKFTILLFIISVSLNVFAQKSDESGGKFSGYMMGDYYKIIDNHNADLKDKHGFWFRRIYFTYDYKIDGNFSTRIRLEMKNAGDFESADKIIPELKDAYLKYKFSKAALVLGLSSTPTWGIVEESWGYRSVEKTALDLQKMGSSRDFGVALKGDFDEKGMFQYHIMFGNGSSNKTEVDRGKSAYVSLSVRPAKGFVIEVYGDYADKVGKNDWYTIQGFLGYTTKSIRAGLQFADQTRKIEGSGDQKLTVGSIYLVSAISPQFSLLGRVDRMFKPNSNGDGISFIPFDPTAKNTLFIGGIDWHPIETVSIIPNIEFVKYDENEEGVTPENDVIARITFFWKFN